MLHPCVHVQDYDFTFQVPIPAKTQNNLFAWSLRQNSGGKGNGKMPLWDPLGLGMTDKASIVQVRLPKVYMDSYIGDKTWIDGREERTWSVLFVEASRHGVLDKLVRLSSSLKDDEF